MLMKPHNPERNKLIFIIALIFMFCAVLLIADSVFAILLVPINLGSFLPGIAGLAIVGFIVFIKPVLSFLRTKTGKAAGWAAGVLIGANVILFLVFIALTVLESYIPPGYIPDAIIVLGAGLNKDRVSITLAARLDTAVSYYRKHPGVPIVASGGQGPNETVAEAAAMAEYLAARGVPADKIIREPLSSNTEENFAFSKAILTGVFQNHPYRVMYVTNSFHIFRAGLYARKASLTAEALAAPTLPRYLIPNYYSREYFALIKYWLFRR